jgi:hypothetical protein
VLRQNQQEIRKRVSSTVNEAIKDKQLKFMLVVRWITSIKVMRGVIGLLRQFSIKRNVRLFKMISFFSIRRIQRMFRKLVKRNREKVTVGDKVDRNENISDIEAL